MNYVLFYPDELRAKSIACYGNTVVKTPNYDRLAREGTLFAANYTTHPVCVASRCSMLTGWYPHVAGFRTLRYLLQPHHPNFMRYLKEAGYQTHLYGKNHVFSDEVYAECVDFSQDYVYSRKHMDGTDENLLKSGQTMLFHPQDDSDLEELQDTIMVRRAVEAIENYQAGDKPFFIFLPLFSPHAPYVLTREYHDMYDPDSLPPLLPADLANKPQFHQLIRQYRDLGQVDDWIFKKIHAVYLGMVSYTDMLLGRVLDALEQKGLLEQTTVIASSDHGDWAGDYGLVEKWPNAFDEDMVKVPLIIRQPGGFAGHRIEEITQTFDIFPTILDLENIPVRHDHFGRPLKEQLAGARGDPERMAFCEGGYDVREPHCFEGTRPFQMFMQPGNVYYPKLQQQIHDPQSVSRGTMLRTDRYKLTIRTNGDHELYDLAEDPDELNNLYGKPEVSDMTHELQQQMLIWLMHTSDVVPWEGHV